MLHSKSTLVFTLFTLLTSVTAQCEAPVPCQDETLNRLNTTDCQTYHAFLARGSDSGFPGHLGPLISYVCGNLTSGASSDTTCGYENIDYPANSTWSGPGMWCRSAHIGATNGQKQMREYAERCPDAKLILLGFSQGGSVALDILGGGGDEPSEVMGCMQEGNPSLNRDESPGSKIVAAAVFGAVRRAPHQPYTVPIGGENYSGNATRTGSLEAGLKNFTEVLHDWCNIGDSICAPASEGLDLDKHLNYFRLYNGNATEWIVKKARESEAKGNGTSQGNTEGVTKTEDKGSAAGLRGSVWLVSGVVAAVLASFI